MNSIIKHTFLAMAFFLFASSIQAQVFDEWDARAQLALKYKPTKKWSVTGKYFLYLDQNFSRYKKSVIGAELEYKATSWLKAGVDYRYGIEPNEAYQDIRYSITLDQNLSKKWNIAYRPALQQKIERINNIRLSDLYWRNRLTLSFEPSQKVELYLFTENYLDVKEGHFDFFRQKTAVGTDFDIKNSSKLGFRFEVINKHNGKIIARPNLSYTYSFGYSKTKNQ